VFGVALSTAALPVVARAFGEGRPTGATKPLNHAITLASFTVLPASAGLIALAGPINGLLFRFGRFDASDALVTASVSIAYAVGIIGHALARVLTPAFYAAGVPAIPVRVAVVSVAANVLLSVALMTRIGVVGLPLATSIVAIGSAVWLGWKLRPLVPGLGGRPVVSSLVKSLLASVLMGGAVWFLARRAEEYLAGSGWYGKPVEAMVTGGGIVLGLIMFAGLAWLFRIPELHDFVGAIRRKVSRR